MIKRLSFTPVNFVEINGVQLHFEFLNRKHGNKNLLILVHGFGASLQVWREMACQLSKSFDVLALDLKGFGFSTNINDHKYSPNDQAQLLQQFIAMQEGDYVVTTVGHSYGAGVCVISYLRALDDLTDFPVNRLVLIDPAIYPQKYPFMIRALRNPVTRFISNVFSSPEYRTSFTLRRLFAPENHVRITDEHVAKYAYFLRRKTAQRAIVDVAKQMDNIDPAFLTDNLGRIEIPVLVIWGKKDPIIPVNNAYKIARHVPNTTVKILDEAGHSPHEESPEQTANLINNFLRDQHYD